MTRNEAREYAARTVLRHTGGLSASATLAWSEQTARGPFDIFLSHSYLDAREVLGVKTLFEDQGFSVYVDWLVDHHLNRDEVSPESANVLRQRMRESHSMVVAVSSNSPESRWMPWELGFFDGLAGRVAVLPLVDHADDPFVGQEYLGLYPIMVEFDRWSPNVGFTVRSSDGAALSMDAFARP